MSQVSVIQNTFSNSTLKTLIKILEDVSFDQSRDKIVKQIQQLSPQEYLWAVCNNPAYFVQYQIKAAAILKVRDIVLIVWKPKFLEYPSYVAFPEIGEKKLKSMVLNVSAESTVTDQNTNKYIKFLQNYYGTYFHSDPDFQTNFITYSKHFISKISNHQYWHAILDDSEKCLLTHWGQMDNILKIRVSGIKDGYDKTILLFSYKGKRDGWFMAAKNKWMQLVAFLAMLLIFYAVVSCPEGDGQQGICKYKQELTLSGTLVMLSLIGVRYTQKSGRKKKNNLQSVSDDKQKQQ